MLDLSFVSNYDLTTLHVVLGFATFFLAVYVMAFTGYEYEDSHDPVWVQWSRRFSYALIATGMIWSLNLQIENGWHPLPSGLLVKAGLIIMFIARIAAVNLRIKREGHRRPTHHHNPVTWSSSSKR